MKAVKKSVKKVVKKSTKAVKKPVKAIVKKGAVVAKGGKFPFAKGAKKTVVTPVKKKASKK